MQDFRRIFQCSTERQIRNLKVMGASSAVIVHDPTLEDARLSAPIKGPIPFVRTEPVVEKVTEPVIESVKAVDIVGAARDNEHEFVKKKIARKRRIRK